MFLFNIYNLKWDIENKTHLKAIIIKGWQTLI